MDDETDLLVLAASAWTELMEYRYCFTYGYRKQLYEICLSFSVQDFIYHGYKRPLARSFRATVTIK